MKSKSRVRASAGTGMITFLFGQKLPLMSRPVPVLRASRGSITASISRGQAPSERLPLVDPSEPQVASEKFTFLATFASRL